MAEQLIIPEKLKIGFNEREDTYTGLLGFITYELPNGTNKHKKSWDNWILKDLGVKEFENVPHEGFIINRRKGGGGRWSYDEREPKVRVWDSRDFEIEITIENMLDILAICGSYPGKGLDGKFVYAYEGNRLKLLPVNSEDYRNSAEYTELNKMAIDSKDLIPGALYISKSQNKMIYLGYYPWIELYSEWQDEVSIKNEHVFFKIDESIINDDITSSERKIEELKKTGVQEEDVEFEFSNFIAMKTKDLAKCLDPTLSPNYSTLIERLEKTGKIFTRSFVDIKPISCKIFGFYKKYARNYDIYEGSDNRGYGGKDLCWIKKDENTYEGVIFSYTFKEEGKRNNYRCDIFSPIGINILYKKKLIITDEGATMKNCSKIDKNIYLPADLQDKEYFDIKLNTTKWITANYLANIIRGYGRVSNMAANIERYGLKAIK